MSKVSLSFNFFFANTLVVYVGGEKPFVSDMMRYKCSTMPMGTLKEQDSSSHQSFLSFLNSHKSLFLVNLLVYLFKCYSKQLIFTNFEGVLGEQHFFQYLYLKKASSS